MRIGSKRSEDLGLKWYLKSIPLRPKKIRNMVKLVGIGEEIDTMEETVYENYDLTITFSISTHKDFKTFIKEDLPNINQFFNDNYNILHFDEIVDNIIQVGYVKDVITTNTQNELRDVLIEFDVVFSMQAYKYVIINSNIDINNITTIKQLKELKEGVDYIKKI